MQFDKFNLDVAVAMQELETKGVFDPTTAFPPEDKKTVETTTRATTSG
ncbi:MAG: hypothetical protein QM811_02605 [Pirellulales bacterium]